MSDDCLIEFTDVVFSYEMQNVITGMSFELKRQERHLIVAPSGVGKTTLLYLFAHLLHPQQGQIKRNTPLGTAVLFQEDRLLNHYTALQNVTVCSRANLSDAKVLLAKLGLATTVNQAVSKLSGGMKRRVALARALLQRSDVLLLDEPFKGLDEEMTLIAEQTIREYQGERAVVMFSPHQLETVSSFSLVADCASWFRLASA